MISVVSARPCEIGSASSMNLSGTIQRPRFGSMQEGHSERCTIMLRNALRIVSGISQDRKARALHSGARKLDLNSDVSFFVDLDINLTQPTTT